MTWSATRLPVDEIVRRAAELPELAVSDPLRGVRRLLGVLTSFPGETWQERWLASGCDAAGGDWLSLVDEPWAGMSLQRCRNVLLAGNATLLCLDVIRPSYAFLHRARCRKAGYFVLRHRTADFLDQATECAQRNQYTARQFTSALLVLSKIMLHKGRMIADITPEDVVEFRTVTATVRRHCTGAHAAWELLTQCGGFPRDTLPLRDHLRAKPPSAAEMVAAYGVECEPVAEALVRYLEERQAAVDQSTLRQLAYRLVKLFWQDIEQHHSGIDSLVLPTDVAAAWRRRMMERFGNPWATFVVVRAFYRDIAYLTAMDPYWARWMGPNPVPSTSGAKRHKRETRAQMHQRIRSLTPHFPRMLDAANEHMKVEASVLDMAKETKPGRAFVAGGSEYERIELTHDLRPISTGWPERVVIREVGARTRIDQARREDHAFWSWAMANTLYYTGMRLEELAELTSTALSTYRPLDGGDAVPLLQIAPSKNDTERVLIVPPELAHVLARVKARVRSGQPAVPSVVRYDQYERRVSAPLPFLFQRVCGGRRRVMSARFFGKLLSRLLAWSGIADGNGQSLHVTPHDFRRVFATEAVAGGLPVHIVATLLGHESLATTQGYTAVYPDDIVRRYRSFIAKRRALRPSEEYRTPTETEWAEFQQHFHERKVELGTCGRGYQTPCAHEHACIRCPLLHVDPAQRGRLEEIIVNLDERLVEARERGWHADVEGLEISIASARKRLDRTSRVVSLGMPAI